ATRGGEHAALERVEREVADRGDRLGVQEAGGQRLQPRVTGRVERGRPRQCRAYVAPQGQGNGGRWRAPPAPEQVEQTGPRLSGTCRAGSCASAANSPGWRCRCGCSA